MEGRVKGTHEARRKGTVSQEEKSGKRVERVSSRLGRQTKEGGKARKALTPFARKLSSSPASCELLVPCTPSKASAEDVKVEAGRFPLVQARIATVGVDLLKSISWLHF